MLSHIYNIKHSYPLLIQVEDMTEDIRASFIDRLRNQTWMDAKTQEIAKEKV